MKRLVVILVAILVVALEASAQTFYAYPVAEKVGVGGAYWQTNGAIQPLGCIPSPNDPGFCNFPLTLKFYPFGYVGFVEVAQNLGYAPGEGVPTPIWQISNLANIFAIDLDGDGEVDPLGMSGVLTVEAPEPFRMYLRNYTPGGGGTYGHYIPPMQLLTNGVDYKIPYTHGRTNVFMLNLGEAGMVRVGGKLEVVYDGAASEYININPTPYITTGIPVNPPVIGFDGDPLIYVFVAYVDNETNDPATGELWREIWSE